jgi:branched-subunit amino acid aminotransferase/4-amino-4-deoxychorismate lyase
MTLHAVAVGGRGLVDPAEPIFRADDEALLRGGVAFETIRSYGGVPFLLDRHVARFRFSIEALALPAADDLQALVALAVAASPPEHVLRLYRTAQALVATTADLPPDLEELRARGLTLHAVDVGTPAPLLAGAKTTSYGEAFAARREAERFGADDALLVAGGALLETTTANVWFVRDGRLHTPESRAGVLPGVTREFVLTEVEASVGTFRVSDLAAADEAFTTSSIREVMPVVALESEPIGNGLPGPFAARLQATLRLRSTP